MTEQYQWKAPKTAARLTGHHPDTLTKWARDDIILGRRFGLRGRWQIAILNGDLVGTNGHRPGYEPKHLADEE